MANKILILGVESSGNRMMSELLTTNGLDATLITFPHAQVWPDLAEIKLDEYGTIIVMIRNMYHTAESQIRQKHVTKLEESVKRISKGLQKIFDLLHGRNKFIITYESLVLSPEFMQHWILNTFKVPKEGRKLLKIYNGNKKYEEA